MTDVTPIEQLEDAVRAYLVACEDEGTLAGWTLAWQTSSLSAEPGTLPLVFASSFTMGPATSPEAAMGLAHLTAARLERALVFDGDQQD